MKKQKSDEDVPGAEYKPLRPVDEVPYENREQPPHCVECGKFVKDGNLCDGCFWR